MNRTLSEDPAYVNVDDFKLSSALLSMRGAVEHELMRHSWIGRGGVIPASLYGGATCRAIATACDGRWGDVDACRGVLSAEMYRELLRIVADLPCRDLDWCLRALSLCLGATKEGAVAILTVAKTARGRRRRAA